MRAHHVRVQILLRFLCFFDTLLIGCFSSSYNVDGGSSLSGRCASSGG